jgi:hypothetical protein
MRWCLCILVLWWLPEAHAGCRSYHYDHDNNPYTPVRIRVACDLDYEIRTIPQYRTGRIPAIEPRSIARNPRHVPLPPAPPKCVIPNVYQLTRYQTQARCLTD